MTTKPFDPKLDPKVTLAQAQEILREHAMKGKGAVCPCCRQVVQIDRKSITSSMAYALMVLYREKTLEWVNVSKYLDDMQKLGSLSKGGDWARLCYWGLLKEQDGKSAKKGYYQLTEKGKLFASGQVKVPKTALFYDGRLLGFTPGDTSIQECLGDLDYASLLEGKFSQFAV